MSKLYFKHAPMKAGKSLELLKTADTYERKGRNVVLFTPAKNDRDGVGVIRSRVGLQRNAIPVGEGDTFLPIEGYDPITLNKPDVILVDEAQFLTRPQVEELSEIVDTFGIDVIAFGLKNDFRNELFEGSATLLAYADSIIEIKTICEYCERKAIMNVRTINGEPVYEGAQVQTGDEEYISVCRKHYKEPRRR